MAQKTELGHHQKLGLKVGLEIHRQLSKEKLFCPCSTALKEEPPEFTIQRNLRAVAGEGEKVDVAALEEMKKGKTIIYHGFKDEACLVCTDSEPPHEINQEALETALAVAKLLKLKIPSVLQPMRKTIVDGSACSGFQRTMLVGLESENSYIETLEGKVKINLLCLEEDAAKIIKKREDEAHYSLSRQGIPLLEIATNPDIKSPKQALETALKIGNILASFPSVKRGLGTIRQDVNVSIRKGARVEIKGVQKVKQIPLVIEREIERQLSLIRKGKKVTGEVRKVETDGTTSFLRPMPGAARLYPETDVNLIKPELRKIKLPELISDKVERFVKLGLGEDLAKLVAKEKGELFEELVGKYPKIKIAFIAETLTSTLRELKRKYDVDVDKLVDLSFRELFELLEKGKINKDIVIDVLIDMAKETFDLSKYESLSSLDLEVEVKKIIEKNKDAPFGALMGMAMKELSGKASGQKISELLKKLIK